MALILSLPSLHPKGALENYTLQSIDANAPRPADISFHGAKHLHASPRSRIDVYRGLLTLPSDKPSLDVICKIGFGKFAKGRVSHEAALYNGKLRRLQGEYVPHCYGYFEGDTDEGPTGCFLLAYCGEPVIRVQPAFKTALIHALVAIHDAGVEHHDLCRRNILDYNGRPMIIDFGDAEEHECERHVPVEEGTPAPTLTCEFGCDELLEFLTDIEVWTPPFIEYIDDFQHIELAYDPHALAKMAPSHWSREEALQEAYRVIVKHVKEYYLAQYDDWIARLENNQKAPDSTSTSPSDSHSSQSF